MKLYFILLLCSFFCISIEEHTPDSTDKVAQPSQEHEIEFDGAADMFEADIFNAFNSTFNSTLNSTNDTLCINRQQIDNKVKNAKKTFVKSILTKIDPALQKVIKNIVNSLHENDKNVVISIVNLVTVIVFFMTYIFYKFEKVKKMFVNKNTVQ